MNKPIELELLLTFLEATSMNPEQQAHANALRQQAEQKLFNKTPARTTQELHATSFGEPVSSALNYLSPILTQTNTDAEAALASHTEPCPGCDINVSTKQQIT